MRREARCSVIGVEAGGTRVLATVRHTGELTAKDRAALEVAVQALRLYMRNRNEEGGSVELKLGAEP